MTETEIIKGKYLSDTLFATRLSFKYTEGRKFIVGEHHKIIASVLDRVYSGEIKRLLITVPPRYSKTEMAVKTFISKGLAINPSSKFIHLSYSDSLALDNSEKTRDIVNADWYQELFPYVKTKKDSKSKKKWWTTAGGGVYATSSAGQVTGFGAGNVEEEDCISLEDALDNIESTHEFSGAIVIDDPLKPEDASSAVMRDKVNNRFETTIRSRVNSRNTPIIAIMQRLHRNDLVGYLIELEGLVENGGQWVLLSLPALSTDEDGNEVALYPFKHSVPELHKIRSANRFVFETQYQQNPKEINEKLWAFAFDRDKHTGSVVYNENEPLYQSWDFNRNPMSCNLFQHYNGMIRGVETLEIDNATVYTMCQDIEKKYPNAFHIVTGDASGKNATTVSLLHNYDIIKNYFSLARGQMQYSGSNPRLEDSRYFVNSILEQYPFMLDSTNCKPLIFDLENVMADSENKIVKDSRSRADQKADHLDTLRYYLHRFFSNFHKML